MLDIKFIRDNEEKLKKAVKDKRIDINLDELLDLDAQRRDYLTELESLKATKNQFSKEIIKLSPDEKKVKLLEMKEVGERETQMKLKLERILGDYERLMSLVPNIPSEETPIGPDESANVPWSYWSPELGSVDPKDKEAVEKIQTKFNFEPKDHLTLAKNLDLVDTERGTKTSGFRGYYLKNEAVLMQYGLVWHALKKMREKGFTLMIPPTLIKEFALFGSGHFPFGRDQVYGVNFRGEAENKEGKVTIKNGADEAKGKKDPLFLAGTSEPSLLAYYSDATINEKDLPIKLCGVSPCYRSEIGSYGKDMKGLYRVHEFIKVEQVVICEADIIKSEQWLEDMREIAQSILMDLKLPHRVLNISTGDMGAGKYKMYDLETWMPGRNGYGETHSDSHLGDWQSRRLNIKYKGKDGKSKHVYTLNNTVIASPRILIAILENYQQADGSVVVPEALKPYVGVDILKPKTEQK